MSGSNIPPEYLQVAKLAEGCGFSVEVLNIFDLDKSPLTAGGRVLGLAALQGILVEFSFFSKALPEILSTAYESLSDKAPLELRHELLLNLAEELGYVEAVGGVIGRSHYDLLRFEIERQFAIDLETIRMAPRTKRFLGEVMKLIGDGSASAFGALAALELSAVPEIRLVREICRRAFEAENANVSDGFWDFLDSHITNFEIQHSARLLASAPLALTEAKERETAQESYGAAAYELVSWWKQSDVTL